MKKFLFLIGVLFSIDSIAQWQVVGTRQFTAGAASDFNMYSSLDLQIDSQGMPYVSFQDGSQSRKATVMKYNGSNWVIVGNAGFSTGEAYNLHLAIDGNDSVYVAYSDATDSSVQVKKFNGTTWQQLGNINAKTLYVDIAAGKNGSPYVTYVDSTHAKVKTYVSGNWQNVGPAVPCSGFVFSDLNIELDTADAPYVGFYYMALPQPGAEAWKYIGSNWLNAGGVYYANLTKMKVAPNGLAYLDYFDNTHYVCGIVNYSIYNTPCYADMDVDSASHPYVVSSQGMTINVQALGLSNIPLSVPFESTGNLKIALDKSNTASYNQIYLAFNDTGYSGKLTVVSLQNTFGIEGHKAMKTKIDVYPNPAINAVTIKSESVLGLISIYNAFGKSILQVTTKNKIKELDLSELPAGFYFLSAQNNYIKLVKE